MTVEFAAVATEPCIVHVASRDGHRGEYLELCCRLLVAEPSVGRVIPSRLRTLLASKSVLFATVDDEYIAFILVSILRSILGRKTVGLMIRPQTCFLAPGMRYALKRAAFRWLKVIRKISVLTIVPFSVRPEYREIARAGLVDPHCWDRQDMKVDTCPDLEREIRLAAGYRKVLLFAGGVSEIKGITFLVQILNDTAFPISKLLPVIAGRFSENIKHLVQELESRGALVIDRFVDADELEALYRVSSLIWTCYDPSYDQASGIFGRAIQSRRVPIVRSGSTIALFAELFSIGVLELEYGVVPNWDRVISELETRSDGAEIDLLIGWRESFIHTIRRFL